MIKIILYIQIKKNSIEQFENLSDFILFSHIESFFTVLILTWGKQLLLH